MRMTTGSSPVGQWTTPSGSLAIDEQGEVTAIATITLRTEELVSASIRALADLDQSPFVGPPAIQRGELGYRLTWSGLAGTRQPLALLAQQWRREPAEHVAEAIAVALAVSRALGELQHLAPHAYLLSPVQVFLETSQDGRRRWSAAPLPIDAFAFKDMVVSSPELTMWLSGDNLVRRVATDRDYIVAAVLYYALIGDLYSTDLSPMRRLQRQIAHVAGNRAALRATLEAAIPKSLATSGLQLGDFIIESLGPSFGRPMSAAQAHTALKRLEGELSAPLLAGGWETMGRPDRALAILESYSQRAPRDEVPWPTLQRLRQRGGHEPNEKAHDWEPAATSPPAPSTPISRLRAIAAGGPVANDLLVSTLDEMIKPGGPALADDERLCVAYWTARCFGADERALSLFGQPCKVKWDCVVRALLLARAHYDQRAWAQVSRDCRECMTAVGELPARGGERGAYVSSFALLLDAAAHIGFVAGGHALDYLENAWSKLNRAREIGAALRSFPLDEALGQQLNTLRQMLIPAPRLGRLLTEVEAASAQFRTVAANDAAASPLPWPEERWLFAQ
jgi:hypothetical protein